MGGRMIIHRLKNYLTFAQHAPKRFHLNFLKASKILSFRCIRNFLKTRTQLDICVRIYKKGDQAKGFDLKTMF